MGPISLRRVSVETETALKTNNLEISSSGL